MAGKSQAGIASGWLPADQYAKNFADTHPLLTKAQALIEAERCFYCYDAPCIKACPTGIDIPAFIQRIAQGNNRGAAEAILSANPLGGMCARVCPTEVLCEGACVRNENEAKPVEIGALQRYATDHYFAKPGAPLFSRGAASGKRVAVVGAGPAGLACAHGLARAGHEVVLFEGKDKLGGLNEYGLATYKTTDDFAQKEIAWLLSIGGIEPRLRQVMGRDFSVATLSAEFDAVFLGLGLGGVNDLGEGWDVAISGVSGVRNAVDFISELRQANDKSRVPVGRKVVVIGGGMTAVDAAVQSKLLGAESVHMVYRRGPESMLASKVEQDWAQTNGVHIVHWAAPQTLLGHEGAATGVRFAYTSVDAQSGKLIFGKETLDIAADMVLIAIGQTFLNDSVGGAVGTVEIERDKNGSLKADADGRTGIPKVWAGGDCRAGGKNLTVEAVEQGKRAAISIDKYLLSSNTARRAHG